MASDDPRTEIPEKLVCPQCKAEGYAVWEENAAVNPDGPQPRLANVSRGFYRRAKPDLAAIPDLVCAKCQTVVAV